MRVSYVTFCDPDGFSATSNGPIRVCHQPDTVNVTEVIFLQRKKNRSPDLYPLAGCLLIHSFLFFVAFLFVSFSSQQAWWLLWLLQSWNGSVALIFGYGHRNGRRGHLPHTHTQDLGILLLLSSGATFGKGREQGSDKTWSRVLPTANATPNKSKKFTTMIMNARQESILDAPPPRWDDVVSNSNVCVFYKYIWRTLVAALLLLLEC